MTNISNISFCTTIKDRLGFLKQVYKNNVEQISKFEKKEWIILDYGSSEDVEKFIRENETPIVKYFRHESKFFNEAHAKNLAHLRSCNNFLVNLDCDVFVNEFLATTLVDIDHQKQFITTPVGADDVGGLIGVSRDIFFTLGGYDESLPALTFRSYVDSNLKLRIENYGLEPIYLDRDKLEFITHENDIRDRYYPCKEGTIPKLGKALTEQRLRDKIYYAQKSIIK